MSPALHGVIQKKPTIEVSTFLSTLSTHNYFMYTKNSAAYEYQLMVVIMSTKFNNKDVTN